MKYRNVFLCFWNTATKYADARNRGRTINHSLVMQTPGGEHARDDASGGH